MQQHSPTFPGTVRPAFPETEQLKCPRCESTNTKFCYYNNYNLLQPRHFCKSCRRYWTKGGSLRNIPVGGGSRKNTKRSSSSSSSSFSPAPHGGKQSRSAVVSAASPEASQSSAGKGESAEFYAAAEAPPGSFSSLLNGQFGNLMEGLDGNGSGYRAMQSMDTGNGDGFVGFQQESDSDSGCWAGGGNGWPDLAMYTPGSSFQQIN